MSGPPGVSDSNRIRFRRQLGIIVLVALVVLAAAGVVSLIDGRRQTVEPTHEAQGVT
jgi:hypothetical protein